MDTNKQIEFYPGQIFENEYPEEAAEFCNNSGKYFIEEIEPLDDGTRRFEIKEIPAPDLEEVREQKYAENDSKCQQARFNQAFTMTIDGVQLAFITNAQTQADLQTALILLNNGVKSYPWTDEAGVHFDFTEASQIAELIAVFMDASNVYDKWAYFKSLIDKAQTVSELNAIDIDYGINLETEETEETEEGQAQ